MIENLKEGIYRICIPFEDIYTSSFVLIEKNDAIIFDSGNSCDDAEKYIIPEVEGLGVNVKYLVSSHTHQDHYGGINALKKAYPGAVSVLFSADGKDSCYPSDGEIFLDRFQMLNLKGHTADCLAVYDIKTKTLLSGDCLQLCGVGRYKTYVSDVPEYFKSIRRIRDLDLNTVIASHDYEPLGFIAEKNHIEEYLRVCEEAIG